MQVSNSTAPAVSFETFSKQYHTAPQEFVKAGAATIKRFVRHKAETQDLKSEAVILGLQAAVPSQDFVVNLQFTPAWFGKSLEDFLPAVFGLKADEPFPTDALQCARLVISTVNIRLADGTTAPAIFPEEQYLKSSLSTLKLLRRICCHKSKFDEKGYVRRDDPDVVEGVRLAISRENKFEKALKALAAKVEGKATAAEAETAPVMTPMMALDMVLATVRTLGDMDAEPAKTFFLKVSTIPDVLTHVSGLDDETVAQWSREVVLPEDVQAAMKRDLDAAESAKAAIAAKAAADSTPAPAAAIEISPADIAAWVAQNQYSDAAKAAIGLDQAELDQTTAEQVQCFALDHHRLPSGIEELDQYSEGTGAFAPAAEAVPA